MFNGLNVIGYYISKNKEKRKILKNVSLGFGEFEFDFIFNGIELEMPHLRPKKLRVVAVVLKDCGYNVKGFARNIKSGIFNSVSFRGIWKRVVGIDKTVFFKLFDGFEWDNKAVIKVRKLGGARNIKSDLF